MNARSFKFHARSFNDGRQHIDGTIAYRHGNVIDAKPIVGEVCIARHPAPLPNNSELSRMECGLASILNIGGPRYFGERHTKGPFMFTKQSPINSGFGAASTAADVIRGIDLTGKCAVVTGGYSGIGIETVKALRSAGAKVIVPVRDIEKAEATLAGMPDVVVRRMDLVDPASINAFADDVLNTVPSIDILINNAGVMAPPLSRDARGNELQFSANHLGHFLLTSRLWPGLVKANGARVISLSSYGHRRAGVDFHDPNFEHREYDPWVAYGQSKTANALFAVALDSIGRHSGVRAFSVHPGGIVTDLVRHMSKEQLQASNVIDKDGNAIIDPENNKKTPQQGAATSIWCATSPQLDGMGGVYCSDCDIARALPTDEATEMHGVRPRATDPVAAGRLWQISEMLTGARID